MGMTALCTYGFYRYGKGARELKYGFSYRTTHYGWHANYHAASSRGKRSGLGCISSRC